MKTILFGCFLCSCFMFVNRDKLEVPISTVQHEQGYVNKYNTPIITSFVIGVYDSTKPYMECYDATRTLKFLEQISYNYKSNDIVEIDGLKWKLTENEWIPYPNPPIPELEQGEDVGKHLTEYRNWIKTHPHFGYPPLPE